MVQGIVLLQYYITFLNNEGKCMIVVIIIIYAVYFHVQIYKTLRVRLVVVHVITWSSGDRINVVSDPETLLYNIRDYKTTVTQSHDSLMLLTYVQTIFTHG